MIPAEIASETAHQSRRALRQPIESSQDVGGDAQAGIHSEVSLSSTRRSSPLRAWWTARFWST
jgi:hypothetical protein